MESLCLWNRHFQSTPNPTLTCISLFTYLLSEHYGSHTIISAQSSRLHTAAALLAVLPGLLSACGLEGKLWKMIHGPSQSGSVNFSQPCFLLLPPVLPNIAWSRSTLLFPPLRLTQHVPVSMLLLTWILYPECPYAFSCTARPCSSLERQLYINSSVKLGKSVCFLGCLILCSDKEYYPTTTWWDPLYVLVLRYRDKKAIGSEFTW